MMHRCLLPILTLLLLLPSASAGAVWTDDTDDVATQVYAAGEIPLDPQDGAPADLRSLQIAETADGFALTIERSASGDVDMRTSFRVAGQDHTLHWGHDGGPFGWLLVDQPTRSVVVADIDVTIDGAALHAAIPRTLLRDDDGLAPRNGTVLDGFNTTARIFSMDGPDPEQGFFCCRVLASTQDDAGPGSFTAAIGQSTAQDGLSITSDQPFRASNGGTTRIIFDAVIHNDGPARQVQVQVPDAPEAWNVEWPHWPLDLPEDSSTPIQVMVETPFGHKHGGASRFHVNVTDGAAVARTGLGIHYLDTPQPSGHHPSLFIHSRAVPGTVAQAFRDAGYASGAVYMNTDDQDPGDQGAAVDSTHSSFGGTTSRWSVCLSPGLLLGLNVTDAPGTAEVTLQATRPHGDLSVSVGIHHFGPGDAVGCDKDALQEARDHTLIAATDAPATGPAGTFRLDLVPQITGPVPYQDGAVLLAEMRVDYPAPDSQAPGTLVLEDGFLTLPLAEYHEPTPTWVLDPPDTDSDDQEPTATDDATKDTSAPSILLAMVAFAAFAMGRRRTRPPAV